MTGRMAAVSRTIQGRLRDLFEAPLEADAAPLEVLHAVLEELERKVQPLGRGARVFPHNRVSVRVAPLQAERAATEATFAQAERRLKERLAELGCDAPGLEVRCTVLKRLPADWPAGCLYTIECRTEAAAPVEPSGEPTPLRLAIVKGAATHRAYSFAQRIVTIGRSPQPVDRLGRARRNDVVFLERSDGITETVGRAHARLQYDEETRGYRLYSESSSNPTFVVRRGATIHAPARDPRGVRLETGDDVHLGRAVVRVTTGESSA